MNEDAGAVRLDPFRRRRDESEGLTNVSESLEAVLEHGALANACAAFADAPTDRRQKLLCGKSMFFYETFGTAGVPEPIVSFLHRNFEEELGLGYTKLGMLADPFSADGRPLGLASTGSSTGAPASLAFTCASCHFARLPDGRYAVGAPNHDYEYGKHILAIVGVPNLVRPDFDPSEHHPDFIRFLEPFRRKLQADSTLVGRFIEALLPLIQNPGPAAPALSVEEEGYYVRWKSGTMDFLIAPLPVTDEVHTVSKISPLWDIPRRSEEVQSGMPHAMLGWTGSAQSLHGFMRGFVGFGEGALEAWPPEGLDPLVEYVYSLTAPRRSPPANTNSEVGAELFSRYGCLECHAGPRGSGTRLFDFDEIGTDRAMETWMNPSVPNGIKSPRLVGLWTQRRFLHNGSVDSLEELLCLNGAREPITELAFGNAGHEMGCNDIGEDDKRALIEYLLDL